MPGDRFDPRTLGSAAVNELLDRFEAAEVTLDARMLPSPVGLPCVSARIVSDDYQAIAGGYGCHLSVEIATTRALTEAAQSRLSIISGSRDDLARRIYWPVLGMLPAPTDLDRALKPLSPRILGARAHHTLLSDLADLEQRCSAVFSTPLLVDLTRPDIGIPVVQVFVPGCELNEGVA
jgi:ribosomal protein S12 methylthiotransferase accessory factor